MINARRPVSVPVVGLTRLLFYHTESDMAVFHRDLDTFHKSCNAEVNCIGSGVYYVTDQEIIGTKKPHLP